MPTYWQRPVDGMQHVFVAAELGEPAFLQDVAHALPMTTPAQPSPDGTHWPVFVSQQSFVTGAGAVLLADAEVPVDDAEAP